jgi:hypothetical protein
LSQVSYSWFYLSEVENDRRPELITTINTWPANFLKFAAPNNVHVHRMLAALGNAFRSLAHITFRAAAPVYASARKFFPQLRIITAPVTVGPPHGQATHRETMTIESNQHWSINT